MNSRHSQLPSSSLLLLLLLLIGFRQPGLAQSTGYTWGIVVGADETPERALVEGQRVQQKLGQQASFFRCNNWIRTVIQTTDRRQAVNLLAAAQRQIRPSSYLVDMRIWCPGKQPLALRVPR